MNISISHIDLTITKIHFLALLYVWFVNVTEAFGLSNHHCDLRWTHLFALIETPISFENLDSIRMHRNKPNDTYSTLYDFTITVMALPKPHTSHVYMLLTWNAHWNRIVQANYSFPYKRWHHPQPSSLNQWNISHSILHWIITAFPSREECPQKGWEFPPTTPD